MIGPDFDHFCRLVHEHSGLVLGPEKAYLIRSRLDPVAREAGFTGAPELLAALRKGGSGALIERCVNALATHESSFFRDGAPFEVLTRRVIPDLVAARGPQRSLRIWCGACSSGQEPYSVAIALQEMGGALAGWRTEIVATDFSAPILEKAKAGLYTDFEVRRGLSPERLARWFEPHAGAWRVSPRLQQMVTFQTHNLLHGAGSLGTFDIVFCRNVLIYFDQARKRMVLEELARAMAPDGALFLGSAETILGLTTSLEITPGQRGLYRRVLPEPARMTG